SRARSRACWWASTRSRGQASRARSSVSVATVGSVVVDMRRSLLVGGAGEGWRRPGGHPMEEADGHLLHRVRFGGSRVEQALELHAVALRGVAAGDLAYGQPEGRAVAVGELLEQGRDRVEVALVALGHRTAQRLVPRGVGPELDQHRYPSRVGLRAAR